MCRIFQFGIFLRKLYEILSGFRDKFQKIVTCVAFSIKFAKTNQKFAENSEFCENYSVLFKIIHWCPYSRALIWNRFCPCVRPNERCPGRQVRPGARGLPVLVGERVLLREARVREPRRLRERVLRLPRLRRKNAHRPGLEVRMVGTVPAGLV